MPRRPTKRRGKRRSGRRGNTGNRLTAAFALINRPFRETSVFSVPIKTILTSATSNGTNVFVLTEVSTVAGSGTQLGARFTAIADCFLYYRLHSFTVQISLDASTSNQVQFGIGWIPTPARDYTAPASAAAFVDFPYCRVFASDVTIPLTFHVPASGMNPEIPWFYTNIDNAIDELNTPGTLSTYALALGTDSTSKFRMTITWNAQFQTPIDPSLNPLASIRRGPGIRERLMGLDDFKDEKEPFSNPVILSSSSPTPSLKGSSSRLTRR
jgi:hypothetical protein